MDQRRDPPDGDAFRGHPWDRDFGGPTITKTLRPQQVSQVSKFAEFLAPYARQALSKGKEVARRFSYRGDPSLSKKEFEYFKKEMEGMLTEIKKTQKLQEKVQSQSSAENLMLKQIVERLANDLKISMEREARNGTLAQDKAIELTKLVDELTKRVQNLEAPNPGKFRKILADIERFSKTAARNRTLYLDMMNFIIMLTTILSGQGCDCPKKDEDIGRIVDGPGLTGYIVEHVDSPGIFEDVGKEAQNLLFGDYFCGWRLSQTISQMDLLFSMGQNFVGGVKSSYFSAKVKKDNFSGLIVAGRSDMGYPFAANLEVVSRHRYAGIRGLVGFSPNPRCNLSVLLGTKSHMFGGTAEIDPVQHEITKFSAGVCYKTDTTSLLFTVNNLDEMTLSLHQECWDYMSVGAQFVHRRAKSQSQLCAGVEYAFNPCVLLKGRASVLQDQTSKKGSIGASLNLQLTPTSSIAVCADCDVRSKLKYPRLGVFLRFDGLY